MFAIILLLSMSVNGFSSIFITETERTTFNWWQCPANIGAWTKCVPNSKLDCYCLVSKRMVREDASRYCHENKMHLLAIENQVENEFVMNLVNNNKDLIPNQFWITGYNANFDLNNWVWQLPNITKPLTFTNWCPGEPDNRDKNEHFMAIIDSCWHDVPEYQYWSSVCKREANILDPTINQQFFFTFPGEKNAVVPCRPVTNDVSKVDISKENNKQTSVYHQIIVNGTSSDNKNYQYDPLKGFVIRNVSTNDNGTYKCSAFVGVKEVWQLFHLIVTGVKLKVEPRFEPLEGSNVTLTCDSQQLKRRNRQHVDPVEWSVVFAGKGMETILTPNNSVVLSTDVQVMFFEDSTENDVSALKIYNVSMAMSGTYRCRSVFHGSENSLQLTSNPFSISILKKVDWSGNIFRQGLKGILTPTSTDADNYRVIPVGSDLRISCTFGTSGFLRYYHWQWEQFDDNPLYTSERNEAILSRLKVTRSRNPEDGTDMVTMLLTNVQLSDRGLFICLLKGSPSMNISQYIYVNGRNESTEDTRFDLVRSSWRNTYNRTLGKPSVIPCRPFHPRIGMDILRLSQNGVEDQIILNGTSTEDNYEYNPQKGFIIHRVLPEHDAIRSSLTAFLCTTTGVQGNVQKILFYIMVTGVYVSCTIGCTSNQRINGLLNGQVNPITVQQGENKIELNCYAYLSDEKNAVIEWFVISDAGVETKISDLKAQTEMQLSIIITKNKVPSRKLTIVNVTKKSLGTFKCLAVQADKSSYSESIHLKVTKNQEDNTVVIVLVTIVVLLLIAILFYFYHKNGRNKFTRLESLLTGYTSQINPNEPMDEQIDLLPYDQRWEFPRSRLRLGKQLGVGCFARVVQAEAIGINDGSENSVSTVAVKMVRSRTNVAAFENLVSELKILIHMGAHVNIINLLGACTKGINRGELLVIVEHCPFGNLRTFIINHRDTFINQVDENGELIASDVENDADDVVTTRKQICWSFQIARGMDYLVTKKVLHGDLAARNILLSDNNVVKVADFGLSRQLYKDENYLKNSKGLLPLKWMAIESLTDRIWSSRSDVWSYGIVLWEIFSLGHTPYQGYTNEVQFLQALKMGYRMAKPAHTPNCVAEVMEGCWKADPNQRLTFSQIEELLNEPLESLVTSFYVQLNEEYQQLNVEKRTYENFSVKSDNPAGAEHKRLSRLASRHISTRL